MTHSRSWRVVAEYDGKPLRTAVYTLEKDAQRRALDLRLAARRSGKPCAVVVERRRRD